MRTRKKQLLFLLCVAILLIGALIYFITKDKEESYSSDFQESNREELVEHRGKKYRYNEHLSNYLFMGIDTREPVTEYETRQEAGRADTIFVLSYDRVKKTVKGIAIPRDTITNIHMIAPDGTDLGTAKDHINMQYVFGDGKEESCQLMKEAVSGILYNVPIQGYCSLNMDGIAVFADILGGVEVTVPNNSLEKVNSEFVSGAKVTITKDNAEQFVRYRDTEIAQSAIDRMNRQKVYLEAVAEKVREKSSEDASLIVDIYENLEPYMVTNVGNDMLAKLLEADFDSGTGIVDIPGEGVEGAEFDEYHVNETELYELILQMFYEEV